MQISSLYRNRRLILIVFTTLFLIISSLTFAQVKITDGTNTTLNSNSILELESSNKGLLFPNITINDLTQPDPLSGTVPAGMVVYSYSGAVSDGLYCWNGSRWTLISRGAQLLNTVSKSADCTLNKSDNLVFASNNITITLPEVTSADTGLQIIVKNTGSHTDLITVKAYGSATIDDEDEVNIFPYCTKIFVARGTNWVNLTKGLTVDDFFNIGDDEVFKTLQDALEFLKSHMTKPVVLSIGSNKIDISSTLTINLPYPLTIESHSYGMGSVAAAAGLTGKPMFRCFSECYFKHLSFDGSTLAGYGTMPGEDAIRFVGPDVYNEVNECKFNNFSTAVLDSTNAQFCFYKCHVFNCSENGVMLHSNNPGTIANIVNACFTDCTRGINLSKGSEDQVQLTSLIFYNNAACTGIAYDPSQFFFSTLIIKNNSWNNTGTDISGFDFTRQDGRDANAYIENNPGMISSKPECKINVLNNSQSVTCTSANQWYKANWTNTSTILTNMSASDNKITYLSKFPRQTIFYVSGDLNVDAINRVISFAIVKNGNTSERYGETTLRIPTADQPFQFSTVILIPEVSQNDYFEAYLSSQNNGDVITIEDIHILTISY